MMHLSLVPCGLGTVVLLLRVSGLGGKTPGFGLVQFPDGDIYDVAYTKYFIVYMKMNK